MANDSEYTCTWSICSLSRTEQKKRHQNFHSYVSWFVCPSLPKSMGRTKPIQHRTGSQVFDMYVLLMITCILVEKYECPKQHFGFDSVNVTLTFGSNMTHRKILVKISLILQLLHPVSLKYYIATMKLATSLTHHSTKQNHMCSAWRLQGKKQ